MSQTSTAVRAGPRSTRTLLACGAVAGPLFLALVCAQAATRAGFDLKWHPISLLSLGTRGWVQSANFVVAGSLYVAGAVGIRRALAGSRGGTWGPRFIGAMGVAMIWAGVFPPDPYHGFPPGTAGPDRLTWHGLLHSFGPPVAFLALSLACLVFARRFATLGQRAWMWGCLVVWLALLGPDLLFGRAWFSLALALAGAVGWGWASLIALGLRTELEA